MTDHEIFDLGDLVLQRGGTLPDARLGLVTERLGVEHLAPITGSSHTSPHNQVFLEGLRAALTADSTYAGPAGSDRLAVERQPQRRELLGRAVVATLDVVDAT